MTLGSMVGFGLREVQVTDADGSNAVALPVAMILHLVERVESAEFTAEGIVVAASSRTVGADWELENGAVSLDVWAKLTGRSVVDAGTTPNETKTFSAGSDDSFPYVRLYGRALGDGSDDVHVKVWQAKLTAMEGSFRNGEFWIGSCAGVAVDDGTNGVFDFVQHETAVGL